MNPAPAKAKCIVKEQFYPYPIDVVWAALTTGEALAQWLMPNTFPAEPRVGSRFQFRVDPMPWCPSRTECEIVEFEPPTRMVWSWRHHDPAKPDRRFPTMHMRWDLSPEGQGTRPRFRQTEIEGLSLFFRWAMNFGWGTMHARWIPQVLSAFSRDASGTLIYRRLTKPPNRGHHGTKTVPPEFFA